MVAKEYARDLTAPPAMTCGDAIFLRRDSLRRLLWEKLESWRWNRPDNALGRAFACYDFEGDLHAALDAMTDQEIQAVLWHEQGEYQVGCRYGEAWNRMLLDLIQTPAEIMARAVRDHLADCLVTLPALAEAGDAPSLHFYLGNLNAMRRTLFPALETAYADWLAEWRHPGPDGGRRLGSRPLGRPGQGHARLARRARPRRRGGRFGIGSNVATRL